MNWWQRFKAWLGFSEPAGVREQVEDWIEANPAVIAQIHADQASKRESRGGYRQIVQRDKFIVGLPTGSDFAIDVYEAPVSRKPKQTKFGYTLSFLATEADGSQWRLIYEPNAETQPAWTDVTPRF